MSAGRRPCWKCFDRPAVNGPELSEKVRSLIETANARETDGIWLACLLALTVLRLILAATVPLAPDEAYYWLWAQHLQAGYYDHPPMVALFIRAGTMLAGSTAFGIRLFGPLAAAAGSLLLWRAAEDFCPHRHAGLVAAGLFNATLVAGAGAILMTPDTPLLLFWCAGLAAAGRLLATRDARWWLAIGVAAGFALLSKYTGVLLVAAFGLWLLSSNIGRRQLKTPWPWAGMVLALAIFAPNLAWNQAHQWVSYLKQGGRVAAFDPARALQYLAELVFGQIGLVTPIIFGLFAYAIWRLCRAHNAVAQLLLWLTLLPAAVFLEHAVFDRVQANWPAIIYPTASIAAACLPVATLGRWLKPALALGFGVTLLVYAQSVAAFLPLPPARDPAALQLAGWGQFTAELGSRHAPFVTSDDYATTAELAFHAPPGSVVAGFDPRWRYFRFAATQALAGTSGILVTRRAGTPCPVPLGTLTRQSGRGPVIAYRLCSFTATSSGSLLP
jgi:4-amino-4-deoxy-L-arabinose transferase-like glycosyltransferase